MTIRSYTDLFCDSCGEWLDGATDLPAKEARALARRRGWKVGIRVEGDRRLHDRCDRCNL